VRVRLAQAGARDAHEGLRADRRDWEIGQAFANELRQLIDFHNVRVYRAHGDDLEPVAWRGEIGEYSAEDFELLQTKIGVGISSCAIMSHS